MDGTVNLWNPAKVVGADETHDPTDTASNALLASLQKHAGGVRLGHSPCGRFARSHRTTSTCN